MNKISDLIGHKYRPRYSEQVPSGFEKLGTFWPPVLYRALRAEGVARWRAWLFWAGVRIGGTKQYAVHN